MEIPKERLFAGHRVFDEEKVRFGRLIAPSGFVLDEATARP
jgi:hypothetical protein